MAVVAAAAGIGLAACGASIQAVYEGDVRFEHCMALDAQPDVKPHIRRACWREWLSFYTYGQTRDRVRHAQMRIRQLSGLPGQVDEQGTGKAAPAADVAAAPGAGTASASAPTAAASGPTASQARCVEDCEALRADCRSDCRTHGCEKSCALAFRSCITSCVSR
ncbi:MAG: hypothetical protein JRI23_04320 [Deltaproteobacteria bacterium]|nr:hypothetical protein [Deltaproteobacteria bacterium]MBW2530765.1 hypothetical protein [Deltaproteobacteria bacterium]